MNLEHETKAQIDERIAKAGTLHPQEPCRVGMYLAALREVSRLRAKCAVHEQVIAELRTAQS